MKNYLATTIFGLLAITFLTTFAGHAATITVNTFADENNTNAAACSLREAINNANGDNTTNGLGCVAGSGTDSIIFSVSGTINLTAVLPAISSSMNIGNNTTTAPSLTVNRSSGGDYRIFFVFNGNTVTMSGLVINNGFASMANGGGIRNDGTLTLNNCVVSNNQSTQDGSGILNQGAMVILNSSIENNTGPVFGVGIEHTGNLLTVNNSRFSGNISTGAGTGGGAIDVFGSNTTITNSTFTNNAANGGGAVSVATNATITNCTFNANNAVSFASGLYIYSGAIVNVTNSTFARNNNGGIWNDGGTLNLRNTIVAGNTSTNGITPNDINGTVSASSPNNIIGTGGAGGLTNGVNGNQTNVSYANVRLLPLGNYGGNVQTMPIRLNSPARNAGTNTSAPATDARGFNRPQATTTDIGAFEIQTNSIVTNINDSGAGSLRQTVADIASGDIIQFETPLFDTAQTISLSTGQITLGKNLTINGNGANILNVQNTAAQSTTSRVFNISTSGFTINLNGVTVSGGNVSGDGGGIFNFGSTLSLTNCVIDGNTATGDGGGIRSSGNMTVLGSTISNNTATSAGGNKAGGIDFSGGSLVITNSTISGNSSLGGNTNAGGIWSNNNTTITNSTITNNIANGTNSGGGIYKNIGLAIIVRNSIIAANQNNATIPDVSGGFNSGGYNLIGNVGTATGFNQPTDQTGSNPLFENSDGKSLAPSAIFDPMLAPLANNGGTVPTHAVMNGSRAIDKGNSFGSTTDSRGLLRPIDNPLIANAAGGDGADIGAFEAQAPTSASVSISGQVFTTDGRGLRNAFVTITDTQGNLITARTSAFGFYRFDEIQVGETYVIEVRSKNFQFAPQIVSVSEELTGFNFYAIGSLMKEK